MSHQYGKGPTRLIWSLLTAIVSHPESADWIGVEILNMFNTGSWQTITKSVVELVDSSSDSNADPGKVAACGYGPLIYGFWRSGKGVTIEL